MRENDRIDDGEEFTLSILTERNTATRQETMSKRHSSNHRRSTGDTINGQSIGLIDRCAVQFEIRNRKRTMARASSTEESLLEKLIRTKYPLTSYLHRQQQFAKAFCSTSNPSVPVPGNCLSTMLLRC